VELRDDTPSGPAMNEISDQRFRRDQSLPLHGDDSVPRKDEFQWLQSFFMKPLVAAIVAVLPP
jgi:hypothetical protein